MVDLATWTVGIHDTRLAAQTAGRGDFASEASDAKALAVGGGAKGKGVAVCRAGSTSRYCTRSGGVRPIVAFGAYLLGVHVVAKITDTL
jgi:hypothetical protein